MNDTRKLLLAFIEASGFDVEEIETKGNRRFEGYENTMGGLRPKYTTDKIVDYKVTKKEQPCIPMSIADAVDDLDDCCSLKIAGARLSFYQIGTDDPKSVYADAYMTIAHPNPAISDEEGRFPELFINKPYSIELKDRYGDLIFEEAYK